MLWRPFQLLVPFSLFPANPQMLCFLSVTFFLICATQTSTAQTGEKLFAATLSFYIPVLPDCAPPYTLLAPESPTSWSYGTQSSFIAPRTSAQLTDGLAGQTTATTSAIASLLATGVAVDVVRLLSVPLVADVAPRVAAKASRIVPNALGGVDITIIMTSSCGAYCGDARSRIQLALASATNDGTLVSFRESLSALAYGAAVAAQIFTGVWTGKAMCQDLRNLTRVHTSTVANFVSVSRSMAVYDRNDGSSDAWNNLDIVSNNVRNAVRNDLAAFAAATIVSSSSDVATHNISTFVNAVTDASVSNVVVLPDQFDYDTAENFQTPNPALSSRIPLRVIVALTIYAPTVGELAALETALVDRRLEAPLTSEALRAFKGAASVLPVDLRVMPSEAEKVRNERLGLDVRDSTRGPCESVSCKTLVCLWTVLIPVLFFVVIFATTAEAVAVAKDDANEADPSTNVVSGTGSIEPTSATYRRSAVMNRPRESSVAFQPSDAMDAVDLEVPTASPSRYFAENSRKSRVLSPS